eukprot:12354.XXX_14171_13438_1 [CDS] Oithona nana genome sequencing.
MSGSSIMTSNLPPELLERINKAQNKVNRHSTYNFETSSGGFIPYHSMTRRATSLGATALSTNADVAQITEASHWLTRNQVGDPSKTAWMINDKGNKVWFRFEHTPSLFPVTETRFYKPKLHKADFLGKNAKDEEREI